MTRECWPFVLALLRTHGCQGLLHACMYVPITLLFIIKETKKNKYKVKTHVTMAYRTATKNKSSAFHVTHVLAVSVSYIHLNFVYVPTTLQYNDIICLRYRPLRELLLLLLHQHY